MDYSLFRFLDAGHTSLHVARDLSSTLQSRGFRRLAAGDTVAPGDSVFTARGGLVIATRLMAPTGATPATIVHAAHTDSPGLRLKHRSATWVDGLLRVPVEVYGGPILATWLDRGIALAGSVVVKDGEGLVERPFGSGRPVGVIPNLAIHLDRSANDGLTYNRQDHLAVVISAAPDAAAESAIADHLLAGVVERGATATLLALIATEASVPVEDLLDVDAAAVSAETATSVGENLFLSPRIDNLVGSWSVLRTILETTAPVNVLGVWFDHEEIGSLSAEGAAGGALSDALLRMVATPYGVSLREAAGAALIVSNDAAHARHPNYRDKHDAGYAPRLGGGPVIKRSAVRRYASDLRVAAWFAHLCGAGDVPVQYLQNRSDIPAGTTIGPLASSRLALRSLDIGIPMLAMHAHRETADERDVASMVQALNAATDRFGVDHNDLLAD